ncbi:hypothetical protein KCP78_21250 [Salmonella enterica subsp. enterica]|nr:hypothetical protein KCP78_21250 [Salmonella enterica subsp. enterica]
MTASNSGVAASVVLKLSALLSHNSFASASPSGTPGDPSPRACIWPAGAAAFAHSSPLIRTGRCRFGAGAIGGASCFTTFCVSAVRDADTRFQT